MASRLARCALSGENDSRSDGGRRDLGPRPGGRFCRRSSRQEGESGRERHPSRLWKPLRQGRREGSWRGGRGWRQQRWGRRTGSWAGAAWTTRTSREMREDIRYSGHHRERRGRAWRRGCDGAGSKQGSLRPSEQSFGRCLRRRRLSLAEILNFF